MNHGRDDLLPRLKAGERILLNLRVPPNGAECCRDNWNWVLSVLTSEQEEDLEVNESPVTSSRGADESAVV